MAERMFYKNDDKYNDLVLTRQHSTLSHALVIDDEVCNRDKLELFRREMLKMPLHQAKFFLVHYVYSVEAYEDVFEWCDKTTNSILDIISSHSLCSGVFNSHCSAGSKAYWGPEVSLIIGTDKTYNSEDFGVERDIQLYRQFVKKWTYYP